jgi:hypothetical protein
MNSKIKGGDKQDKLNKFTKLTDQEILKKFYFDNLDLKGLNYDGESYQPKKTFYDTYFHQNRKNFLIKSVIISGVTFVIGCGFGIFMLALQSFGTMGMMQTFDDKKYKYENLREVRQAFASVSYL